MNGRVGKNMGRKEQKKRISHKKQLKVKRSDKRQESQKGQLLCIFTSITRFLGGRPLFLLNMASIEVVKVIVTGSLLAELKFHFLVYSWSL